ncbi:ATP-binding cassette domain-containing protein [Streptomyces sp. NBC_00503]|nr:ATP-binding cassette domain-containing protein [Streptomyces sp. NBC_00503]WUD85515.1 ATP-binding cassette domain-containing protein [Streptomyces sp. NBC_00503]
MDLGRLSASGSRDARAYRRKVAWLPQRPGFLPGLTAREHVAYMGWLKGMRERDAWAAAPEAIDRVGLAEKMNDRIKTLSGGRQQRVVIAASWTCWCPCAANLRASAAPWVALPALVYSGPYITANRISVPTAYGVEAGEAVAQALPVMVGAVAAVAA